MHRELSNNRFDCSLPRLVGNLLLQVRNTSSVREYAQTVARLARVSHKACARDSSNCPMRRHVLVSTSSLPRLGLFSSCSTFPGGGATSLQTFSNSHARYAAHSARAFGYEFRSLDGSDRYLFEIRAAGRSVVLASGY